MEKKNLRSLRGVVGVTPIRIVYFLSRGSPTELNRKTNSISIETDASNGKREEKISWGTDK